MKNHPISYYNGQYNFDDALIQALALSASMAKHSDAKVVLESELLPALAKIVLEYSEENLSEKIMKAARKKYYIGNPDSNPDSHVTDADFTMGSVILVTIQGITDSAEFQKDPEAYLNSLPADTENYFASLPSMAKVFVAGFLVLNNPNPKICLSRLRPGLRSFVKEYDTPDKQLEHIRKLIPLK